ncbi:MAG: FAD-dependent oxidoreductase [Haloarculaceae archaeon]
MTDYDVVVVGSGVAGLTAGIFVERAGLDALLVDDGESILERNAHLENVPGFPAGVNSRTFLDLTREQAERNGCSFADGRVARVDETADGFALRVEREDDADEVEATYVVCTSWSDVDYLADLDVGLIDRGSKTYVDVDEFGRTGVPGLYAAGRLAEKPHQTVVAAGHGAEVALALVDDSEVPFYHDWVAPEGYFTGRGREVPPGCEEIDEAERRRRERESLDLLCERFAEPHPGEPTQHPSVAEDEE